jgi:RNA polymerase primary sigma factor
MDFDQQQSQLKSLIAKGKEQGYLTYHEVNDHLPDGIVDPEQIEDIISMINDMGIAVHETAPDEETLLLNEATAAVDDDEDAAEEAAAALATLDAEFGRTTDPVRMYMREMGTVDLLTREGEIQIAKRIEEGLTQVLTALATYPETIGLLLKEFELFQRGEIKLTDVISGFVDEAEPAPTPVPDLDAAAAAAADEELDEEAQDEAPPEIADTGPDPEEARARFEALRAIYEKSAKLAAKNSPDSPRCRKVRQELADAFLHAAGLDHDVSQVVAGVSIIGF